MPEKTLKEKVEMARKALKRVENTSEAHLHYYVHEEVSDKLAEIDEALTALEERNERLWVFIRRIEDRFDEHDLWRDNKDLLETYEELRKEAPDGE